MSEDEALRKARTMVLRLLSYRARSRKEVSEYLERKGFPQTLSESVIKEMESYGYINDEQFAEDFILSRKSRGYGIRKVSYELYLKGIDDGLIDQKTAEHFDPDHDLIRIKEIIEQRHRKRAFLNEPEQAKERAIRREAAFLKRRGFQENLILKAFKDFGFLD